MSDESDAVSVDSSQAEVCGELRLEYFAADDPRLLRDASDLRNEVLIEPFGLEPIAWKDDPKATARLGAFEGERLVGYACLIGPPDEQRIRQVAVAFDRQRCGVGTVLVEELVREAKRLGASRIWLSARLPAIPFYERLGFTVVSDEYVVATVGLPHRDMELL